MFLQLPGRHTVHSFWPSMWYRWARISLCAASIGQGLMRGLVGLLFWKYLRCTRSDDMRHSSPPPPWQCVWCSELSVCTEILAHLYMYRYDNTSCLISWALLVYNTVDSVLFRSVWCVSHLMCMSHALIHLRLASDSEQQVTICFYSV